MRSLCALVILVLLSSCEEKFLGPAPMGPFDLDDTIDPVQTDGHAKQILTSDKLEPFYSSTEFYAYVDALREEKKLAAHEDIILAGDGSMDSAPAPVSVAADAPMSDDAITNNQEYGVDEGGIVKAAGDYLIVLRRGRLFSIRTSVDGAPVLTPTDGVDAFPAQHSAQTWYDEMLVHDKKIIVIGYSYGYGATEIGLFELGDDGKIHHQDTRFLRSNDYYSSRNYASRLINDRLVFYMPIDFLNDYQRPNEIYLPAQARLQADGKVSDWRDIIDVADIIKPIEETRAPLLHTIVMCDLSTGEFNCDATGVIGPSSRSFYVSAASVYLWTAHKESANVYRLPLDGSSPTAIKAQGAPVDQFSFKETDDGFLHVILRKEGGGDAMWSPEFHDGTVALMSVALNYFDAVPRAVRNDAFKILPEAGAYSMTNRFIGDHVFYGAENGWDRMATNKRVFAVNFKTAEIKTINLDHDVQRIEAIDEHALIVGNHDEDLMLSLVDVYAEQSVIDTFTIAGSSQGERRSHGFFYKHLSDDGGMLGLPTRDDGADFGHLFDASAAIAFLSVNQGQLRPLGSLSSITTANIDDSCKTSCMDWYGNSRPIFLGDRILGLMGYDLVEGVLNDNKITEKTRINFMPQRSDERHEL